MTKRIQKQAKAQPQAQAPVAMKTVRNLMSGKPVVIRADTPYYMDPSMETYWCR